MVSLLHVTYERLQTALAQMILDVAKPLGSTKAMVGTGVDDEPRCRTGLPCRKSRPARRKRAVVYRARCRILGRPEPREPAGRLGLGLRTFLRLPLAPGRSSEAVPIQGFLRRGGGLTSRLEIRIPRAQHSGSRHCERPRGEHGLELAFAFALASTAELALALGFTPGRARTLGSTANVAKLAAIKTPQVRCRGKLSRRRARRTKRFALALALRRA